MEHRPYPKIPVPGLTRAEALPAGAWVATEKVHGAHVQVACDGSRVFVGKRKAWLAPEEPFFGVQLLRPALEEAARVVADHLDAPVRLYGELCGGGYPHEAVTPIPGLSPVQTGVWYCPQLVFVLFDVLVERGEGTFLAWAAVEALAEASGVPCAPRLGRGPRSELERLPVRYPTRAPATLGLPSIVDNVAEGFVLRPDVSAPPAARPAVKRKIPEFSEDRFGEGNAFDPNRWLSLAELKILASWMVNPARLASARSKVGEDLGEIRAEVVFDVLVDLRSALPLALATLSADGGRELEAHVRHEVGSLG